jgi:ComF family protein
VVPPGVNECGDCLTHQPPWDACLAAVPYAYPWSSLIADFKFRGQPSWARPLALLMRSTPFVEPALERTDLILPMPLSGQRLRERGYNQAWQLARHLAPGTDRDATGKLRPDLLLRILDTAPQAELKRAERLRNLMAAFAVDPLHARTLQSKRVVLVDDVMTSGASLHAASLALRAAGAAHITCVVLARTELPA